MTKNIKTSPKKNIEDGNDLFRAAMSEVKQIKKRQTAVAENPHKTIVKQVARPYDTQTNSNQTEQPNLNAGVATNLDRRTMDKLRKGQLRPEARIDLHGLSANDAHHAFSRFISRAYAEGDRCVLVITGKGSMKQGGGVIRRELPHWVNMSENRKRILGFATAQPTDGGNGAFYILLKRKR